MVSLRWLGVAGIELTWQEQVLLVDPYVTRIPFWRQWVGPIASNRALVREKMPRADAVLVTHAHYDHLLDVPEVLTNTGALGVGSANTCQLLACSGIPTAQILQVKPGDSVNLSAFQVEVLPATHGWAPGFGAGPLRPGLKPPLAARDYRMEGCYSYLIEVDGLRLLVISGELPGQARQADVLFANPSYAYARDRAFMRQVKPAVIIPIHWDDFWRPLDRPVRPMFQPPRWAVPPFTRVNLQQFQQDAALAAPDAQLKVVERFHFYSLKHPVDAGRVEITGID